MKNKKQKFDFGGYATKVGVKCSDGRTILSNAFAHMDGKKVPLVYQHIHHDPKNVLGHAILENRKDGVYAYCSFNDTPAGQTAKKLVKHGDITALSIYANGLIEKMKNVSHGVIREVSLVLSGANPEAYIDNLSFAHADGGIEEDETEAIISLGALLAHGDLTIEDILDLEESSMAHAEAKEENPKTVSDVMEELTEEQRDVVLGLIAHALDDVEEDGDDEGEKASSGDGKKTIKHSGGNMKKNIFDRNTERAAGLTRDGLRDIFTDARNSQMSLKAVFLAHGYDSISEALDDYEHRDSVLAHAGTYGINNIDYLFPDAKTTTKTPQFLKRDTDWVDKVFGAAKHVPFSRIKTVIADITADEARARGYITGNQKVDEVITLLKRTTDPQTVYKKQKIDRDDIVDITDFDVIVWLRMEMRMMLNEEIARAQLIGDGRLSSSDDKIKEDKIRPIAFDDDLYSVHVEIPENTSVSKLIDQVVLGRKKYKGSGMPSFFTTPDVSGDMLLLKDTTGRRIYNTESDLAAGIRAKEIVEVPVMENVIKVVTPPTSTEPGLQKRLIGISVNMKDYSLGADKGGAVNFFDDFDIDFNQNKYLIEARCSGSLTMPHSAIVYWKSEVIPPTE